jgi:16S rRNA (uracil1498-N3)-methyltransferase
MSIVHQSFIFHFITFDYFAVLYQISIMELFYAQPANISGNTITLDDFEARHLLTTLRRKVGDTLDITDGKGRHFTGRISSLKPLQVRIESQKRVPAEDHKIALAIAFIRPNRLEFVLEKCTELGVNSFYLFRSEHGNYFSDNKERFEKMLRQAIKQSNRFYLPDLYLIPGFEQFISQTKEIVNKLVAIDPQSPALTSVISQSNKKDVLYCVGPEGGFSEKEIKLFKENGFKDIALGKYRLRAETAAIAGISCLRLLHP